MYVYPSVFLSSATRVLCDKTKQCTAAILTRKGNHPGFLTPTVVGGRRPVRLKFALKVTHPFKTRRLRPISAYNISTVRDGENRKSTSGEL